MLDRKREPQNGNYVNIIKSRDFITIRKDKKKGKTKCNKRGGSWFNYYTTVT